MTDLIDSFPAYISAFALFSITAVYVLHRAWKKFTTTDELPELIPIEPLKKIDTPFSITMIEAGLFIKNFIRFDFAENNFIADATVWFEFNPSLISLDTVSRFSFEKATVLYKSEPVTRFKKNLLFAQYDIRVQFITDIEEHFFPFNDHIVSLMLVNKSISPHTVRMHSIPPMFTTAKKIYTPDWRHTDFDVASGYYRGEADKNDPTKIIFYQPVNFILYFKKFGLTKILILFIPLYIIFFLCIISLVTGTLVPTVVLTLSIGSLTALTTFLFVVQGISPKVGYLTSYAKIYICTLVVCFITFMINILLFLDRYQAHASTIHTVRVGSFYVLLALYTLSLYLILKEKNRKSYALSKKRAL